jgi:hypothetical protein
MDVATTFDIAARRNQKTIRKEPLRNLPFPGGGGSGWPAVPCNDGGGVSRGFQYTVVAS